MSQHAHPAREPDIEGDFLLRPPIVIETTCGRGGRSSGRGSVGRGAVIGARACVFKDVEGGWVYGGNPARKIKEREGYS